MRITDLDIRGFRAFSGEQSFDLDADVVLLTGANGRGKTSVFDGILWALTGALPRLESQSDSVPVVSLYSSTGQARVRLGLTGKNQKIQVIRSEDASGMQRVQVRTDHSQMEGDRATYWILNELWPLAQSAEKAATAFSRALTRSVYLQQDLVRQFVEADSNRERFDAVSELVGAGRIGELNATLDTERRTWKSRTKEMISRAEDLKEQLHLTRDQRDELGDPIEGDLTTLRQEWEEWWSNVSKLGVELRPPPAEDSRAASTLDQAMKTLTTLRRNAQRNYLSAEEILAEVKELPTASEFPDQSVLEEALLEAQAARGKAQEALVQARKSANQRRAEQIRKAEAVKELATLAEIALRHLDGPCPVCQQHHSQEKTRQHLHELINEGEQEEPTESQDAPDSEVEQALREVEKREEEVAAAEAELSEARQLRSRSKQLEDAIKEWLQEQGASRDSDETLGSAIEGVQAQLKERISSIDSQIASGEEMSLRLATIAQEARREELNKQVETLEENVKQLETTVASRNEASNLADRFIEELEEATRKFVTQRLDGVGTLLQRIYAKVDPHPTFRSIRLTQTFSHRRGRLDPYVLDPQSDAKEQDPFGVMSSSQINVVALSIFLALNFGIRSVPLKTLILDDPLQSLDDINLLGFVDLIRRARGQRQMFLATHDNRLAGLLTRKLRPVKRGQQTRVFSFLNWTREGPEILSADIEREESPMRLVAA